MTSNDPLANILSNIWNAEKVGKKECFTCPASKVIISVLNILREHHYIDGFQKIENSKGSVLHIFLNKSINKCLAIKPRYAVKLKDYGKFEKRYLIGRDIGLLVVSTSKGIMTHKKAIEKRLGGRLLAYCY